MTDATGGGEGYELNFENTPIAMVAKAVLGDILGVGYAVDPRVQGTISLSSGRAVPKSDLLYVLESVLRMNNIVLVRDGSANYRLIPLGDATGGGNTDSVAGHTEPGYGVSVVTLRHVSAAALVKLLDSFAVRPGQVRADPARNLLLIQGTGPERRNTMETALSFDVDWMRGQSVGIFPIQYSNPEPIIAELEKILDAGDGGLSQGNIKFQVMARMNGILVVTKKPDLLKAAETWIKRLDTSRHQPHRRARLSGQLRRGQAGRQGAQRYLSSAAARAVPSIRRHRPRRGPPASACRWAAASPAALAAAVPRAGASGVEGPPVAAAAPPRRDFRARSEPRTAPMRVRSKRAAPAWAQAPPRAALADLSSKASGSPPTPRAIRC